MMDYTARIAKLRSFRAAIASGNIMNDVEGFSTSIPEWKDGHSQEGYYKFTEKVKKDSKKMVKQRQQFLSDIDTRISYLKEKIEQDYSSHLFVLSQTLDKEPNQNKLLMRAKINRLSIDSAAKTKLLSRVR